MTLGRQPTARRILLASLLAVAALLAPSAYAEQATATPAATPATPAATPAKPAAAPAKGWLRDDKPPAEKPASAPAGPSNARMALLSGLVAILAGAAYIVKRRRRVVVRGASSELSVVTAAKVGAKADVVIVSVGGRRLLLGVTESQVSRLCWLEGDPDSEDASDYVPSSTDESGAAAQPAPSRAIVPHRAAPVPARSPARGFKEALLGALGCPPVREDAAVAIAAATEDVVVRTSAATSPARVAAPAGAPEMVDIEGQAKGLLLRLQKRG